VIHFRTSSDHFIGMTGDQTKSRPTMQAGCAAEQQMQTKTTVSARAPWRQCRFNPLRNRCGFVFFYGYYFTFFGYRQTPTRAEVRLLPA
jgi:hypothetical protein